jgi:hypothetical protein
MSPWKTCKKEALWCQTFNPVDPGSILHWATLRPVKCSADEHHISKESQVAFQVAQILERWIVVIGGIRIIILSALLLSHLPDHREYRDPHDRQFVHCIGPANT